MLPMEYVKVVIVGGGAAGLGAAKTLGASVDYLLIEAQDYLGGRIRIVDAAPNVVVDLGAQFIHGKANNIVYELCEKMNCIMPPKTDSADDHTLVITSDRAIVDPEIMRKAGIVWEEILEEAAAKFGDLNIPVHYSFSDYLLQHFKERLLSSLSCSTELVEGLMDYFGNTELIENGCSALSELSLGEYGSFEYLDGEYQYQFQNGGYRPLISHLKSLIPDERIRLNSEVIRVQFLQDTHQLRVDVRDSRQASSETITTIRCDHLIWTSSLGYLKANFSSIFATETDLLAQKREAIESLGFDTVNKVVLIYEKRFWSPEINEILLIHTQKPPRIDFSESLKALLDVEKVDVETSDTIVQAIHRYDVLTSTDVPVLISWFGGPAAVLIENFSPKLIGQVCHEVLCDYLNISAELHPPVNALKSGWHHNRFIRGSYSYYSTKSSTKHGELLRTAYVPDEIPRIQFAGEATHAKFYSTVHGALESGIREATRLLSVIKQ